MCNKECIVYLCASFCCPCLARNEIGFGNFFIFLSVLMTSIGLGTNLWTREYFNYEYHEVTTIDPDMNPYDWSPSSMRLGAGLFSMVVEDIPNVYNRSLPLRNGVYPYTNCSQLSIYEFASPTPAWGCRELYLAGAVTFALCLVALLLYFAIFVIVFFSNGSDPPRWKSHRGELLALALALSFAIGLQLAGVLVWVFRGSPAMLDFGTWWRNQPYDPKIKGSYWPPGFLHKLSSSFDLCCASLVSAGIAWAIFLVRGCFRWCKRKRYSSALPADGIRLPSAPSVDSDHIRI